MVKILFSIAIFISYGLQGFVAINILWGTCRSKRYKDMKIQQFLICMNILHVYVLQVKLKLTYLLTKRIHKLSLWF